jgi:SAM-dependent methyltransferase
MSEKLAEKIMIYSSVIGNNAHLFEQVVKFYIRPGQRVADVSYGKGVFWRKVDLSQFDFYPSDIITCPQTPYDFCDLPYDDNSFDVVVFDPPYVHNPGRLIVDANYKNRQTTRGMYHDDILELYGRGMAEACRILKPGGLLWVKCKDEVESSTQRWSHIEIFLEAINLGFYARDIFILIQTQNPIVQFKSQQHSRKNHSYLWIFEKGEISDKRMIMQQRKLNQERKK